MTILVLLLELWYSISIALSGFKYLVCTDAGNLLAGLPLPLLCVLLPGFNPSHPADKDRKKSAERNV